MPNPIFFQPVLPDQKPQSVKYCVCSSTPENTIGKPLIKPILTILFENLNEALEAIRSRNKTEKSCLNPVIVAIRGVEADLVSDIEIPRLKSTDLAGVWKYSITTNKVAPIAEPKEPKEAEPTPATGCSIM